MVRYEDATHVYHHNLEKEKRGKFILSMKTNRPLVVHQRQLNSSKSKELFRNHIYLDNTEKAKGHIPLICLQKMLSGLPV